MKKLDIVELIEELGFRSCPVEEDSRVAFIGNESVGVGFGLRLRVSVGLKVAKIGGIAKASEDFTLEFRGKHMVIEKSRRGVLVFV